MAQAVRGCVAQGRTLLISCATIAAVSSGVPPAAIAVIRISGPLAILVATTIAGTLPPPRQAALRALRDVTGELLDRALVLQFPGPDSATGEDLVEFHCHGGRAVVEAVERVLYAVPGVRQAEPGEFTRRALEHGRIDLTEAEGLADLLEAETETQRRAALAAAEGHVSRAIRGWMDQTAMLSARVEAAIDYGDEGDAAIEAESLDGVLADMTALKGEIDSMLAFPAVERWRDGIRVIVAGPPNAGKSTLVNLLSGRDAAIVSAIAGTTRDLIEVSIRRNGVGYVLIDTAGVHGDSSDVIERQGMARASDAMATADIVLWLGDEAPADTAPTLWIHSKADMPGRERAPDGAVATISANDLGSHQELWRLIEQRSSDRLPIGSIRFHRRHRLACSEAADMMIPGCHDLVLLAERLRIAHRHFAAALGLDATDMMLDALFSRFCVGK